MNSKHRPIVFWVKDGVWISTHDLETSPACFRAVVQADQLNKDVSQSEIVKDEAYSAVVRVLGDGDRPGYGETCSSP